MNLQLVCINAPFAPIPQENRPVVVQQQDVVINTTVLNILRRNPSILNTDLGSIIRANFPPTYYNAIKVQVYQEFYKFPAATRALNTRVINIIPIDASEGLLSFLYTTLFLGTNFEDYIYNGNAMGLCLLGIQGSDASFAECTKALEDKRPIIVRIAENHIQVEVEPDSPPLCIIA